MESKNSPGWNGTLGTFQFQPAIFIYLEESGGLGEIFASVSFIKWFHRIKKVVFFILFFLGIIILETFQKNWKFKMFEHIIINSHFQLMNNHFT